MQRCQSFLIPLIQQSGVCHHLQKPVARVDPPKSQQIQKMMHITTSIIPYVNAAFIQFVQKIGKYCFLIAISESHNDNRLTRPQNEAQISSVWTFGPARPLIPACFSQTLVFPVYRRNGGEYSPRYPHHWGALSHSRAVDKPKEPFGELHTVFKLLLVTLTVEGSSDFSFSIPIRKLWEWELQWQMGTVS